MKNRRHRLVAQPVATSIKRKNISLEQAKVFIEEGFTMNEILKYCIIEKNPTVSLLIKPKPTYKISHVIRDLKLGYSLSEIRSFEVDFRLSNQDWIYVKKREQNFLKVIPTKSVFDVIAGKLNEVRWSEIMNKYKMPDSISLEIQTLFNSNSRLREYALM